jgi:hypothetical protein
MTTVPSENILKLRELTDQICNRENHDEYKEIVLQLKDVLDDGKEEIANSKTVKTKVKCYESMCMTITKILSNIKIH